MRDFPFVKMHGSGNDFVLLDNRALGLDPGQMPDWARRICRRGFGVGADGLILLDAAPPGSGADYVWHFLNADGSRAEMCGNGSRCAARLAVEWGLAGPEHVLGTDAGPVAASVLPDSDRVRVALTSPSGLALDIVLESRGRTVIGHFVNTGVPHLVIVVEDAAAVDVAALGRELRFHERFQPAGTNVNFISPLAEGRFLLRTYERGVEAETFACGTGAAAAGFVAKALGLAGEASELVTSGGETLQIFIERDTVLLQGPAVKVFTGVLFLGAVGLSI